MKEDADQLIAEAADLLGETSGSREEAVPKTEEGRPEQKQKRSMGIDNAKIDSQKSRSPEQSFWFKLAESIVGGSE